MLPPNRKAEATSPELPSPPWPAVKALGPPRARHLSAHAAPPGTCPTAPRVCRGRKRIPTWHVSTQRHSRTRKEAGAIRWSAVLHRVVACARGSQEEKEKGRKKRGRGRGDEGRRGGPARSARSRGAAAQSPSPAAPAAALPRPPPHPGSLPSSLHPPPTGVLCGVWASLLWFSGGRRSASKPLCLT